MSVQISIVHYAEDNEIYFNDLLVEQIRSIKALTKHPYRLNIIDNQMSPKARKDLDKKIPDIEILRTSGKNHTFPVGANYAVENMKGKHLFLSHTDMLMSWDWLGSLFQNINEIERQYGTPCATCPILLFYPRTEKPPSRFHYKKGKKPDVDEVAGKWVKNTVNVLAIKDYMDRNSVPNKNWYGLPLAVSKPGLVTNNGWRLGGAYMASKVFFDEVGPYDPLVNRMNDKSYGITALMTRCRVTTSNKVYLHHLGGLHKLSGCYRGAGYALNGLGAFAQFKMKWGFKVFKKVQNGDIWPELHKAQASGSDTSRRLIEKYRKEGDVFKFLRGEVLSYSTDEKLAFIQRTEINQNPLLKELGREVARTITG